MSAHTMNNTVTLSQLITRLAETTGADSATCRRFVRALFATIEDELAARNVVVVKGIGTFRLTEGAFGTPQTVAFVPDATLAKTINAPFDMFEPVPLAKDVDFSEINEPTPALTPGGGAEAPTPIEIPETQEDFEEEIIPSWPDEDDEEEFVQEEKIVEKRDEPQQKKQPQQQSQQQPQQEPQQEPQQKKPFPWLIVSIILIVVAAVSGYLLALYATADLFPADEDEQEIVQEATAPTEEAAPIFEEVAIEEVEPISGGTEDSTPTMTPGGGTEAPTPTSAQGGGTEAPSPKASTPKTDTVTKKRFLATMAREYYGHGIYWVYIYEANKDKIANPNQIKPGTVVVIPDKSSFEAANDKETLRQAEIKQAELFRRFK